MCDFFWQRMENDRGDLNDVVRSGGWAGGASSASNEIQAAINDCHLPSYPSAFFTSDGVDVIANNFGDPLTSLCDPLLNELTGIELFGNGSSRGSSSSNNNSSSNGGKGDGGIVVTPLQRLLTGEEKFKKPRSIMPRVVFQVASAGSGGNTACPLSQPEAILVGVGEMMKVSSGVCSVDDASSTRAFGIKRRRNQVKRVVCIPAPAAASSRPSGEVVPSDLWAWRKYGQKPIKGSPYPRGYYRCSSSKGCSARKQVERSRTNPNMLVVTYTSEHNHPWPTQRNALAGSTRSPGAATSKNVNKNSIPTSINHPRIRSDLSREAEECLPGRKEEEEEEEETSSGNSISNISSSLVRGGIIHVAAAAAAAGAGDDGGLVVFANKGGGAIPDHDDDHYTGQQIVSCELQEVDDSCLFRDLAELELESDPTSLNFSKVFLQSKSTGDENASYMSDALSMFN